MPPRSVVCYICGREFGSKSINIHLPQCEKKWEIEQSKLPKSQRRPLPKRPQEFEKVAAGEVSSKALQDYNEAAYDDWNKNALVQCPNCSRTFFPSSLEVHSRSCKPKPVEHKRTQHTIRPGTYTKSSMTSSSATSSDNEVITRETIIDHIRNEAAFDSTDKCRELMKFVRKLTHK